VGGLWVISSGPTLEHVGRIEEEKTIKIWEMICKMIQSEEVIAGFSFFFLSFHVRGIWYMSGMAEALSKSQSCIYLLHIPAHGSRILKDIKNLKKSGLCSCVMRSRELTEIMRPA